MNDIINTLSYYFEFPFVRYALAVGVLVALCSAIFGVILVLKGFSFIGDGLSHAAFGALATAAVLGFTNELVVVLPATAVLSVLLLKTGQKTKIRGDAAVAMVSVGALAIGYLLFNMFSVSSNIAGDVCGTLFGATSILTLSKFDVWLCVILSAVVLLIFVLFYNRIFAVTFDEDFASAAGNRLEFCNTVIAVITSVIIVLAMNLVGSLLISALIIFPAISAMRVFKTFKSVVICSAVVSVVCAVVGIVGSILLSVPVGPGIVAINIICFVIFFVADKVLSAK